MADEDLINRVHGLSDLELAALLCLISREHCMISTPPETLDDLVEELQLVL
jgi:predicted transcriptional regulator